MASIHPALRVLGSFVPKGAHILTIGLIKNDFECCVPLGVTISAVDAYQRGKLDKYDGILIDLHTSPCDKIEKHLSTFMASGKPISFLDNSTLPLKDWSTYFDQNNYEVYTQLPITDVHRIIQIRKKHAPLSPAKKVLVLSQMHTGNFAERIGFHLLTPLIPEHATVEYGSLAPFKVPDQQYDLVIVGFGNSLDQSHLTPDLMNLLGSAKHSIGIFGTQYRERIIKQDIKRVLASLDYWFARHYDDLNLFGEYAKNALHFGDWSIHLANMVEPSINKKLEVGDTILKDHPLDRTIQSIQHYKHVITKHSRVAAIALTSADTITYKEQRADKDYRSGKFSSLFYDVFGFAAPENMVIQINKQRVREYKKAVAENIKQLHSVIHEVLR